MQGSIGLSDTDVERLVQRVDDRRHLAAGRARVARDSLDLGATELAQADQDARAEAALRAYEERGPSDAT
jgi:hypothetical protein